LYPTQPKIAFGRGVSKKRIVNRKRKMKRKNNHNGHDNERKEKELKQGM